MSVCDGAPDDVNCGVALYLLFFWPRDDFLSSRHDSEKCLNSALHWLLSDAAVTCLLAILQHHGL